MFFLDCWLIRPYDARVSVKPWRSIIEEDPIFHDMHLSRLISSNNSNSVASASATSLGFVILERVKAFEPFSIIHYACFAEYKHHDDDQKAGMCFKRWKLSFKVTLTELTTMI